MRKRPVLIGAAAAAIASVALGGGAAIANATSGDDGASGDDDAALTGKTLDQASAAALKATGGGKVSETEHESGEGATYEVEVTKPNGANVEVTLDAAFKVVAVEGDDDGGADSDD